VASPDKRYLIDDKKNIETVDSIVFNLYFCCHIFHQLFVDLAIARTGEKYEKSKLLLICQQLILKEIYRIKRNDRMAYSGLKTDHGRHIGRLLLFALWALVFNISIAQVPSEGLVGYWPFNGNANDMSGNGNHGILDGQSQQPQLTVDRFGNPNGAYQFGGYYNKNWIRVPHNSSMLLDSQMTVSFWFQQCEFSGMDGWGHFTTTNAGFSLFSKAGDGIAACPGIWIMSGLNAVTGELSISSSNKNGSNSHFAG
jgi:hypothetical protein